MRISVCMATYNGERFIHQQLSSILCQLKMDDELVVSDDSSTDRTVEIIESMGDNRVKVLKGQKFRSPIFNFENAIRNSKHEIIVLADQDDVWYEGKIEKILNALSVADTVIHDCKIIDESGAELLASYFQEKGSGPGFIKNLLKNSYLGCCMAFKRDVLNCALPFPKQIPMHDIWLGFVTDLFFRPVFITDKLVGYRKHSSNASSASSISSKSSYYQKMLYRINIIKYLPMLFLRVAKKRNARY